MASTYEKGEGNEYLWDIQYAPGIQGAVWFNTHRHPVKWVRGSQMLRQVVISGGCGHPGPASFICFGLCAQSCLTLWDPMDCSSPDSSVHGIFLARILEWVATSFSRGSSWPRDRTHVPCVLPHCKQVFYRWTTREALNDFNGVGIVKHLQQASLVTLTQKPLETGWVVGVTRLLLQMSQLGLRNFGHFGQCQPHLGSSNPVVSTWVSETDCTLPGFQSWARIFKCVNGRLDR